MSADEAFVTSTSLEVTPVVNIDGHTIGQGAPGKITQSLLTEYHHLVRQECYV